MYVFFLRLSFCFNLKWRKISLKMVCEWWIIHGSFDSIKGHNESAKRVAIPIRMYTKLIQDVIKANGIGEIIVTHLILNFVSMFNAANVFIIQTNLDQMLIKADWLILYSIVENEIRKKINEFPIDSTVDVGVGAIIILCNTLVMLLLYMNVKIRRMNKERMRKKRGRDWNHIKLQPN